MNSTTWLRFGAATTLAAAMTTAGLAQVTDVSKDPRLQKPISLRLKIAQLPDALKQISKLTGVTLQNVATIGDLKITVLVKDEPAGLVLDKVASVLGCEWKADGDTLRIGMDLEEQRRRDKYYDAEDKAAQQQVQAELDQLAGGPSSDGSTQTLAFGGAGGTPAAFAAQPDASIRTFLQDLNSTQIASLWRGDVVVGTKPATAADAAATQATAGDLAQAQGQSQGVNQVQVQTRSRRGPRRPLPVPIFLQYDPFTYQVRIAEGGSLKIIARRPDRIIADYAPAGALATMPFGKEVLGWDQPAPTEGDWSKIIVSAGQPNTTYANERRSVADCLEKVFNETDVPIVADAFRVPADTVNLNRGASPLSTWLTNLKTTNHVFLRTEDGVILIRHGGFWRLRRFETPEDLIAPLEAKSKGAVTLDDYAAFVAKLTPEEAKPFSLKNGSVATFDTRPIEQGLPALLFYGTLDSDAVAAAMQQGVAYGQLQASQKTLFVNAALEGVFLGTTGMPFNEALLRLDDLGDGRGLGFAMRKGTLDGHGVAQPGQTLLFGVSTSEAASYKIPIAQ